MYYQPRRFNLLPEVIKNLLIINGLFFLATIVFESVFGLDLGEMLGLYLPGSPDFKPYQLVTHMFMHGNFGHIFLNMFALWMFGTALENYWGGKRFLIYYLVTGFGAAALHLGVNYYEALQIKQQLLNAGYSAGELQQLIDSSPKGSSNPLMLEYLRKYFIPTVGASGAVFGVLLAFGMTFPNQLIYLYFAIPIKAKYFVILYGALELYNGLAADQDSNIAHFAHLGGMLFGFLLLRYWRNTGSLRY